MTQDFKETQVRLTGGLFKSVPTSAIALHHICKALRTSEPNLASFWYHGCMRTITRDIAVGLVVSKDNKFLFGMKDPKGGGVYADCWHTPGGGIEEGETKEEALKREMTEELGLNIDEARVSLLDDKGVGESKKTLKDTGETVLVKMRFYVYRIEYSKDAEGINVTPGDDIEKFLWADPAKLKDYKLTPPSVELFTRLNWM